MKSKLLITIALFISCILNGQTISIVGTGVNGWPENLTTPEITLSTNDNISFFINNLVVSDGAVKFRRDLSWTVNWGGSTFPNGTGVQDGPNIPTTAGTYDVTLNITNGTYTFIPSQSFPSIGIWGPAVNSQLGYAAPDVDMTTSDGIIYTLSGFFFSSGQAYFRQDNATNFIWGSTSYPTGVAVLSGPSLFIPGGEHFVTFNRLTGEYSFTFPSIGVLGTALNGFDAADTDLVTSDGFAYMIDDLPLNIGELKFRKDNSWLSNWGANVFPSGIGSQNGPNIPVTIPGDYSIYFDRLTGEYNFFLLLGKENFDQSQYSAYPNPSENIWHLQTRRENILSIVIYDVTGNLINQITVNDRKCSIDCSHLSPGLYFAKINTNSELITLKLMKK